MSIFEREKGVADRVYSTFGTAVTQEDRILMLPPLTPVQLDALKQLVTPVWDGNLISKAARSELCRIGLVSTWNGLNFCTQDGYCTLDTLGFLTDSDKFTGGKPWKK